MLTACWPFLEAVSPLQASEIAQSGGGTTAPQCDRGKTISAPLSLCVSSWQRLSLPFPSFLFLLLRRATVSITDTHTCWAHGELPRTKLYRQQHSLEDRNATFENHKSWGKCSGPSLRKLVFQISPQDFIRSFEARRHTSVYFLQYMGSSWT